MYFAMEVDNWPVAVQLWTLMIGGCPLRSRPIKEEIETWNAIADSTHLPIYFDTNGLLVADDT